MLAIPLVDETERVARLVDATLTDLRVNFSSDTKEAVIERTIERLGRRVPSGGRNGDYQIRASARSVILNVLEARDFANFYERVDSREPRNPMRNS